MKRHWQLWLAAMMAAFVLIPGACQVQAHAQPVSNGGIDTAHTDNNTAPPGGGGWTCKGKYRYKSDFWSRSGSFWTPTGDGFVPEEEHKVHLTDSVVYSYCPNHSATTNRPKLARFLYHNYCWWFEKDDEEHFIFDGVRFWSHHKDNQIKGDLVSTKVSDDGSRQNCDTAYVELNKQPWHEVKHHPKFATEFQIVRGKLLPDESTHWFHQDGHPWKRIHPHEDTNIGDWIEGTT